MGIIILPYFDKWIIKEENSFVLLSSYDTKEDAVLDGIMLAKRKRTELTVFNINDEVENSFLFE